MITSTTLPLPSVTSPAGYPTITGWANLSEVLDGAPVHVGRMEVYLDGGHVSPTSSGWKSQAALIVGTEYTFSRGTRPDNVALIWRTVFDPDIGTTTNGNVLCLGSIDDRTAKAVCFQNYELKVPVRVGKECPEGHRCTYKAGFLLPEEITAATIDTTREPVAGCVV